MSRPLPPLAWAALALLGALVLGLRLPGPGGAVAVLLAVGLAALALLRAAPGRLRSALGFAALAAAGYALGAAGGQAVRHDCRALLPDGARLSVRGVFEARPLPGGTTPFRIEALRVVGGAGGAASGEARRPSTLRDGAGWRDCAGTVRARPPAGADAALPEAGQPVEVRGRWWAAPAEGDWPRPAEFSGTLFLDGVEVAAAGPEPRRRALLRLRDGAPARLRRLLPARAAVAEALLLAQTGGLDPEVRQRFALSGLSHLLSISGQHVGLIAGTLLLLFRIARVAPRAADGAAAAAITAYVL